MKREEPPSAPYCTCCGIETCINHSAPTSSSGATQQPGVDLSTAASLSSNSQALPTGDDITDNATPGRPGIPASSSHSHGRSCSRHSQTGGCEPLPGLSDDGTLYKCQDCVQLPMLCRSCILKEHAHTPFHKAQVWEKDKRYWFTQSIARVGLILNLGHGGQKCRDARDQPRQMVAVHEGGLTSIPVHFCLCADKGTGIAVPESIQLLEAGFWPGSWLEPRTMFTLGVLDEHAILSRSAALSTDAFWKYLVRNTDGVDPSTVEVSTFSSCSTVSLSAIRTATKAFSQLHENIRC